MPQTTPKMTHFRQTLSGRTGGGEKRKTKKHPQGKTKKMPHIPMTWSINQTNTFFNV